MILLSAIGIAIVILVSYYFTFPKKDDVEISNYPETYWIRSENSMVLQKNYECAAYSSAYVLRSFGVESDGEELYKKYPRKLTDGTISPKGIIIFFRRLGFRASYYYGDVNTLKVRVSEGTPVIVFIRVFPDQRYLHFVPVVGYDKEYFYLADSLEHTINCNETYYNRKISIRDFTAVWKTWVPFGTNTYIVITQ